MNETPEEVPPTKRSWKRLALDALLGLAVSAAGYLALAAVFNTVSFSAPLVAIGACVILAAYGILSVKFLRTGRTLAAILMLVFIAPVFFLLLAAGACMAAGPLFG